VIEEAVCPEFQLNEYVISALFKPSEGVTETAPLQLPPQMMLVVCVKVVDKGDGLVKTAVPVTIQVPCVTEYA
jgi:hypothetical protein